MSLSVQEIHQLFTTMSLSVQHGSQRFATFPKFLYLPPELRDLVYAFALEDTSNPEFPLLDSPSPLTIQPRLLPGICFANRQTHTEAVLVCIRHKTLAVGLFSKMVIAFLTTLPFNSGFEAVRSLRFRSVYWFSADPISSILSNEALPSGLSARCPGLRRMSVGISAYYLITQHDNHRRTLLEGQTVEDGLRLTTAYEHPSLRSLEVRVEDCQTHASYVQCTQEALVARYAEYLRVKSEEAGGRVHVSVTPVDFVAGVSSNILT
jgi:hypothetical protein